MYVAAAVCMWVLRAWKIRQIQQVGSQDEKAPAADPVDDQSSTEAEMSILRCLLAWKKV